MNRKWFYPMQEALEATFKQMYPERDPRLAYQVVTKDRVFEQYTMLPTTDDREGKQVMAIMTRHGKNGSLVVYEMNYVAGGKFNGEG